MTYDSRYWKFKSVRDPLYGFTQLSEREAYLIGTPFMHRLTRIKQLAHTYLVYPSAVHTRFEHSLGVLRMADRLCECFNITDERKEVIRCATLLHDVGHGPFSHLFENIMVKLNGEKFTHEDITKSIIRFDDDIRVLLEGKIPSSSAGVSNIHSQILEMFDKSSNETDPLGKSILSGTIDADKLDYLRRDSYHTGSTYGIFDLERMLSTLTPFSDSGKEYPAILEKGTPVLESFRLARYLLYIQVYQHHTRLIADRMFLRALEMAIFDEKKIEEGLFSFYDRETRFLKDYLNLDDHSVYELVLSKCNDPSSQAHKIMDDLKNRRLFKRAYTKNFNEISPVKRMSIWKREEKDLENQIATEAQVSPELVIVHKDSEEGGFKSYRTFGRVTEANEIPIIYIDKKGCPKPYDDRSPISLRKEPSEILYVFTRPDFKDKVAASCSKCFD